MLDMRFDGDICKSCPFRRSGKSAVRLTLARVKEIAGMMLQHGAGGTFGCHEVVYEKQKGRRCKKRSVHCAGALVFAEANNCQTLPMQLAYRIGVMYPKWEGRYRPRKYRTKKMRQLVFSTKEEMEATAWRR
jgi:hypothetical protein